DEAAPGVEAEVLAGLALARRRRLGPFRPLAADDEGTSGPDEEGLRQRDLGVLARAGFARDVALRVIGMEAEDAMALVIALKSS
ncbi:recombinase RecA, partial [Ameyamaea chiangmaiensis]|nr:recombinase RecA [Ameyamaea chiangmaiensis]